ncbi:hypothetical protein JTB14_031414 [Gonioctena quinquepunctata]|nr:hypothetical protein JTB14_031414 [Gonioctena quinquepunctata]
MISGGKSVHENVYKGMGEYFFEQAERYANNIFQIDGMTGERETFASVNMRSSRVAANMRKHGITPDDVIVTCLKNNLDTIVPHIGTLYLGAKYAAMDPIQTDKDWIHCLQIVKPKMIFVDHENLERMEKCLTHLVGEPIIIVSGESDKHETLKEMAARSQEAEKFRPEIVKDCRQTAIISFSSGTTSLPKAVGLSHFSCINQAISYLDMNICDPKMMLVFSTFYWISSVLIMVRAFVSGGCRVVPRRFHPVEALKMIEEFKVTYCIMPVLATKQILEVKDAQKYDTSSLFHYFSAGTTINPERLSEAKKLFKHSYVTSGYGCSELGSVTAFDLKRDKHLMHKLSSVGKCLNDVDIKIVDEETRGKLGPNQEGEICVRSLYCMNGFYNMDLPSPFDSDGFLKTGDKGYYDEDECLYIVGRCNETFKNGSLKIVPSQWEAVLQQHPGVQEAGVFPLLQGLDVFLPAACVVLKQGVYVSAEEIHQFFQDRMTEKHKIEGGIKFVDKLPKTPSMKMRRKELIDLFMNN